MRKISLIIGLFLSIVLSAQEVLEPRMINPIRGSQYTIEYNTNLKIPIIVYYIVYGDQLGSYGRYNFHNGYLWDTAKSSDYSYTGYDKGHMFSSASSKDYTANYESFDMINILPQSASLNRGLWKQTEVFERNNSDPYCYVICGVILDGTETRVNGITVPNRLYKVIYNPVKNCMIAFILSQTDTGDIFDYITTVDKVESLINRDLFYQLPDEIEFRLEGRDDLNGWSY